MDLQVWHEGIELKVTDAAQKGATLAFAESASVSLGRDGWILLAGRFLPGKKWMLLRGHIFFSKHLFFLVWFADLKLGQWFGWCFKYIWGFLAKQKYVFFLKWRVKNNEHCSLTLVYLLHRSSSQKTLATMVLCAFQLGGGPFEQQDFTYPAKQLVSCCGVFCRWLGEFFFFEHVLTVPTGGISDFVLEPQLSGFFLFVWEWIGTPHSNTCKLPENFDWHGLPCPTTVKMRQILIMAGHRHPFEEGGITYTSHMFVPSPWSSVANGRPIQVGLDNLEHKAPDEVPLTGGFWTNVNQMRKRQTAHVAPIYIYLVTCHRW